ncbi:MAG: DUF2318 domain-containing protein [Deltaproteobacteria bacterium]|nr:DUF2318 domain-containing protein [Deltaproteobacteria bacterium]
MMKNGRGGGIRTANIAIAVIMIVAGFAAFAQAGLLDGIFGKSPAEAAKAAGVIETADVVKIPLKTLDSGKALFLRQESEGRQLHYFALKSSDGAYRAALDACDVCFRMNRGYRQEGDLMVCNNCGQTFPSVKIGEIKGGCNPHPLPRKVEGEYLVIKKSDIAAGKDYFARKRS